MWNSSENQLRYRKKFQWHLSNKEHIALQLWMMHKPNTHKRDNDEEIRKDSRMIPSEPTKVPQDDIFIRGCKLTGWPTIQTCLGGNGFITRRGMMEGSQAWRMSNRHAGLPDPTGVRLQYSWVTPRTWGRGRGCFFRTSITIRWSLYRLNEALALASQLIWLSGRERGGDGEAPMFNRFRSHWENILEVCKWWIPFWSRLNLHDNVDTLFFLNISDEVLYKRYHYIIKKLINIVAQFMRIFLNLYMLVYVQWIKSFK